MKLESENIFLRALEKDDCTKLMIWENTPEFWRISDTEAPYSMFEILSYIERQENFRNSGQLRLIICLKNDQSPIGCIDLYDGNFKHRRAAVGILIAEDKYRGLGYAQESLNLLIDYATKILDLHQLYCYINKNNISSFGLFINAGFEQSGVLKQWRIFNKSWDDVIVFQKILSTPQKN